MAKRLILASLIIAVLGAVPFAQAHNDSADPKRCDNWYRDGHEAPAGSRDDHHHTSTSDVKPGDPANTSVHGQSGHYVVRNNYGYVEVVGGQSYKGPNPQGKSFPGQGGFVQGEVDPGSGAPDADFNAAAFGPDTSHPAADPNWATGTYARGCANAAGNQAEQQSRNP